MPLWTKGGALEIEVKEQTDTTFTFNVVRCRYAETYKAMGLGEIGHLLSCNRDGAFCEGYDPKLKLERTPDHHAGRQPLRLQVPLRGVERPGLSPFAEVTGAELSYRLLSGETMHR